MASIRTGNKLEMHTMHHLHRKRPGIRTSKRGNQNNSSALQSWKAVSLFRSMHVVSAVGERGGLWGVYLCLSPRAFRVRPSKQNALFHGGDTWRRWAWQTKIKKLFGQPGSLKSSRGVRIRAGGGGINHDHACPAR